MTDKSRLAVLLGGAAAGGAAAGGGAPGAAPGGEGQGINTLGEETGRHQEIKLSLFLFLSP